MFFRVERKAAFNMQSQLGPIALVTLLSAASYFNDLRACVAGAVTFCLPLVATTMQNRFPAGTDPQLGHM